MLNFIAKWTLYAAISFVIMPIVGFFIAAFLVNYWLETIFSVSPIDLAISGNNIAVVFWVVFTIYNIKKGIEWYCFSDIVNQE